MKKSLQMNLYVTKSEILGTLAKYAVIQSPYHRPDNLEIVLDKMNDLTSTKFLKAPLGIKKFSSRGALEIFIHRYLTQIPEYIAWNDRKNGNDAPVKFTSRYDTQTDPDDDFIDLSALEHNVVVEIGRHSDEVQG